MFLFRCRDMNTFPIETLFFDHNKKARAVSPSNQNEFNNIQSCGRVACSRSLSPRGSVFMQQQPFWAGFKESWVVNPLKQSFADRTTNSSSWWKRDGMLFALISLKPMSIVCQIIALWACLKVVLLPSFRPGTGCNLSWTSSTRVIYCQMLSSLLSAVVVIITRGLSNTIIIILRRTLAYTSFDSRCPVNIGTLAFQGIQHIISWQINKKKCWLFFHWNLNKPDI